MVQFRLPSDSMGMATDHEGTGRNSMMHMYLLKQHGRSSSTMHSSTMHISTMHISTMHRSTMHSSTMHHAP